MKQEASPFQVTLSRRGTVRWADGHPWIYASDVTVPAEPAAGDVVAVHDSHGRFLGQAFLSRASRIVLRRVSLEDRPVDRDFFRARIHAADDLRRSLLPGETAYRAVHSEADGLPGLIVDRYGDWLVAQFLIPAMEQRRELITELLVERFGCRGIANRSDARVRRLEGLPPDKGILHGEVPDPVVLREGSLEIGVRLLEGQKTGAFLDQRENHLLAGQYARGAALDCFSYVGGFALQMARSADQVTAVELSAAACEQIRANAARNGLTNVDVACANVFDFLRDQYGAGKRYDTIVLDPPAFAKNRDAVQASLRGYKDINLRAMQLLRPGGWLITSSCSHHVDETAFEAMLQSAASDARRDVQIIERRGAGRDHPVLLALRETRYLKCYVLRVV